MLFCQIVEDCVWCGWLFYYVCLGVSIYVNIEVLFVCVCQFGVCWMYDDEMDVMQFVYVLKVVEVFLSQVDYVYLMMCFDVLLVVVVFGVSVLLVCGVGMDVIELIVDCVVSLGKLWLVDVVELNLLFDIDNYIVCVVVCLVVCVVDGIGLQGVVYD